MDYETNVKKIISNTIKSFYNENQSIGTNTYGIWDIRGEDPNCDFGGSHSEPHLGYAEGTLNDVAAFASTLKEISTWGSFGHLRLISNIIEIEDGYYNKVISGEIEKKREELRQKKKNLEEALAEINSELGE